MLKPRSPKFPFIRLERALSFLPKLVQLETSGKLNRITAIKAMGYASFHGAAAKVFAALHAYDLIARTDDALVVTETGRALAEAKTEKEKLPFLQRAALSPLVYRNIWRRARNSSQEELSALLRERGFTEKGATRAARIYRKNSVLAQLEELDVEPNLPERGEKTGMGPGRAKKKAVMLEQRMRERMRERRMSRQGGAQSNSLQLPLSTGKVIVPKRITEDEFQLIMQTLRIWKPQLVKA